MRRLLVLAPLLLVAAPGPAPARPAARAAAVCASFPNQAAAQRAHDTRDPDGDGVFCESLPCPCAKPGGAKKRPAPRSPAGAFFTGRCRRGIRADRRCTSGARFRATARQVCAPGWSRAHRHVSPATKRRVYRLYGIRRHRPYEYEVDHLISLELGGSNSVRNLWPEREAGARGARVKDGLENSLHADVCAGRLSLAAAQKRIALGWSRR